MTSQHSLKQTILLYLRPQSLVVFALGMSQGAPFALIAGTLTFWLAQVGISKSTVGLFGLVGLSYSLKFVWSPLLDRMPLPYLSRHFGQRRSWLMVLQACLIVTIGALGYSDPANNIMLTATLAAVIAFLSASQDIVLDAYRIEILKDDEQGAGAAMIQYGWRVGALLAGAGALALADPVDGMGLGYALGYSISGLVVLAGLIGAIFYGEPAPHKSPEAERLEKAMEERLGFSGEKDGFARYAAWIYMAVIAPFQEFASRRGWALILIFVLLFKFGDAVAANQTGYLFSDLGFSGTEVAVASKVAGLFPLLIGIGLGGVLYFAVGAWRALLYTGIMMMVTNLMFVALAGAGHNLTMLVTAVSLENFASGMGGTAVVAYLSGMCNRSFTATQYALLSAVTLLPRSIFASLSGFVAEAYDWQMFFIISTVLAIPGLVMLFIIRRISFDPDGNPIH